MTTAPLPEHEDARLQALADLGALDAPGDAELGIIAGLGAQSCACPIALIGLIDRDCYWIKAGCGLPGVAGIPRAQSFCAHAIAGHTLLEVPDLAADPRFAPAPLVAGAPHIRFYAGMPLVDPQGFSLGTLCVMDHRPRRLAPAERQALVGLARLAVALLDRRCAETRAREGERRQSLIADFGRRALADPDPEPLVGRAVWLIGKTLDFEGCEVLELAPDRRSLILHAAAGFAAEASGRALPATRLGIRADKIVALKSLVLIEQVPGSGGEFVCGVEVLIPGPEQSFGVIGAYSARQRVVTEDDVSFIQSVANIVATALTRRQTEEKLMHLAQFDALTGLPNRHLFRDRLTQGLVQCERSRKTLAILALDIDRFKWINNLHGHAVGDELLREVGRRLVEALRPGDTVSRIAGDEFGIILSDLERAEDTAEVAAKLLATLLRPFERPEGEAYLTASVGIALFPANGRDADSLIKHAGIAMHRAKDRGRNTYQFFAPQMNQRVVERLELEHALRRAVERREFVVHYQPKVAVETGEICGAEALVRWNHPSRGLVAPGEFIPMLEDSGLILPLGLWVLETACTDVRAWRRNGLPALPVAVNLSARQFQDADLDARVSGIIEACGVPAELVELEITESVLMADPRQAIAMLVKLKQLGLALVVDDFGTGYSSLAYLKQFPLDRLKIDRAFVRDITNDPDDATIALAVINLAHNLRLGVVAEGVETQAQYRFLARHGCDMLQGFYVSKPVEAQLYAKLLAEGRRFAPRRLVLEAPVC